METIKAKLVYYNFNLENAKDKQTYNNLVLSLKAKGLILFDSAYFYYDYEKNKAFFNQIKEIEQKGFIEIEIKHLFNNQYNTKEGLRVFDWYEQQKPNKKLKEGYYLILPKQLIDLKNNTFKCGYCGKQYFKPNKEFCLNCLDSEFLKEEDLNLLRLKSISDESEFNQLNEQEKNFLLPLYNKKQREGRLKRLKEDIKREKERRKKDLKNAQIEYKGFMWLIKNNLNYENVIYYSHKGIFCFGWRNPLSFEEEQKIKTILEKNKFPFKYEFKIR